MKAVYPGSFDPITNGHLDIIKRASCIFDELMVVVLVNPDKNTLFSVDERVELIKRVVASFENVNVSSYLGLTVNFVKYYDARVIIRGLRALSDFENEFQMALMNNKLAPTIETIFMMTNAEHLFLSSSAIKQVAAFGGCVKGLVPDAIIPDLINKFKNA
ncbi:MAG TPA: pantetheine-phosphate adenylyltransferase [Clostridiaceae bacterium]